MIDWHTHVLPEMDDGSHSVEESIRMLQTSGAQGVSYVIATPHFLANEESVDAFLQRRHASYASLQALADPTLPRVLCGAEVKYYPGISKLEELGRLTVEGTSILLLEMPMVKWTEYTVKELIELAGTRGLTVVLAHIERYWALQDKKTFTRLRENGLLMQVNASFFDRFGCRRRAFSLLQSGLIQFIGSDCHNMTSRAPHLACAYERIAKKLGEDFASQMIEYSHNALGHNL